LARVTEALDAKTLEATFTTSGSVDPMVNDTALLDAVFLAESVDHANWQALARITAELGEGELRDRFQAAVDRVTAEEDEHLTWAREMRMQFTVFQVDHGSLADIGAKVEDLIARLRKDTRPG